jgi:hypothetical protein
MNAALLPVVVIVVVECGVVEVIVESGEVFEAKCEKSTGLSRLPKSASRLC